jgi:zinc protease
MRTKKSFVIMVFILLAFELCFFVPVCHGFSFGGQKSYAKLKYPKLGDIVVPEVERVTLPNGMQLFLLEDHELPLISISARIRTGSAFEPADKIGLASITGIVMRTGGTTSKTGDQIDEELEQIAASVETGIGLNSGYASMSVLKEDIDTGLAILADVLMNPAFREDKIELAKVQHRSAIARRNDQVAQIAGREFEKLIYGPDSVYARQTEYATIDNISRDDLIAFHKKFYYPNNMMLAVCGDFDSKEIVKKIKQAFADWKKVDIEVPVVPQVSYEFRPTVNEIHKDDINQACIRLGHIGCLMNDPDYFALIVMNRILGGGFTSRLFKNVRSREGLAYSVFGNYSADFDHPGVFYVGCQTKSQSTVRAIRAMVEEVKKMTEDEVTDEELAIAKEAYLNSFVFNFDSKGKIVNRLLVYEYFGYPADFLQKTKENVEKVTKADVLRVARKHLQPDKVQILAVGRPQDFDEPMSALGPVTEIDITIPTPKEELPAATDETITKGRDLLAKAVSACGGAEAFAAVNNCFTMTDVTLIRPQGEMQISVTSTFVLPDRLYQILVLPMGELKQVVSKDEVWMVTPQGTVEVPQSQRKEIKARLFRDVVNLFRMGNSSELSVQYLGREQVDGNEAEVILVSDANDNTTRLFIDAKTFMPLKQAYKGMTEIGPSDLEEIYSDVRDVSGIKVPFLTVTYANGSKQGEMKITEAKFNVEIDPNIFQKQ